MTQAENLAGKNAGSKSETWIGRELPNLTLESSEGKKVNLPADLRGQWTVLYFYPKDDTPGCTRQACSYRDHSKDFSEIGARIYGISADDMKSHQAFIQKFGLNFPLLSDPENQLSQTLGVYGDQEWKGQVFKGLSRDTFLIDPQGRIKRIWRKVSPDTTMQETLEAVRQNMQS